MALQQHHALLQEEQNHSCLLDALYCEEETWEEEAEVSQASSVIYSSQDGGKERDVRLFPLKEELFLSEDDDDELVSLFCKEQEQQKCSQITDSSVLEARQEAVEWMLKVVAHYGFSPLTSVLAIDYLERFLSSSSCFQQDKPWMIQLAAVTCLSLAAKVEEIQVPLLLDLQVEETKYVFEAKTIQRMELLVLSTLKWKMHPVTPLSFLDYIIQRLGLKTHLHWHFYRRCEYLLPHLLSDARFVGYLPSVLATATMMHVIDQLDHFSPNGCHHQLLGLLKMSKEKVSGCYETIKEFMKRETKVGCEKSHKRKYYEAMTPSSPSGVIDAVFSSDNSNDSWSSSSVSSSPEPAFKKTRTDRDDLWFFMNIVGRTSSR